MSTLSIKEILYTSLLGASKIEKFDAIKDLIGVLRIHVSSRCTRDVHEIYEEIVTARVNLSRIMRKPISRSHEFHVSDLLTALDLMSGMSYSECLSILEARFGPQVELPKPTWYDITSNLVSEVWTSASQLYGNLVGGGVVDVQSTDEHGVVVEDDFELVVVA